MHMYYAVYEVDKPKLSSNGTNARSNAVHWCNLNTAEMCILYLLHELTTNGTDTRVYRYHA
jgi:hypothetical protein